jgi:hypothetical protein
LNQEIERQNSRIYKVVHARQHTQPQELAILAANINAYFMRRRD